MFRFAIPLAFISVLAISAIAQDSGGHDKNLDVRSSMGDLHVGKDADARRAGLPLYPGARPAHEKDDDSAVNLGVLTEAFGMKLVVAKYESDDAPGKIIDFYREKLTKYGKVLECHTREHGGNVHTDVDDHDSDKSQPLKCGGDNSGPVTELKVGTEDNQHVVAVEPGKNGRASSFALVYVHMRGKKGDI